MGSRIQTDARTKKHVRPDGDGAYVKNDAIEIGEKVFPYVDITALLFLDTFTLYSGEAAVSVSWGKFFRFPPFSSP